MKYTVTIQEIVSEDFDIEANSKEKAIAIAEELYKKGEFVLEPGNLLSVEITV